MVAIGFLFALVAGVSSTFAHPLHHHQSRDLRIVGTSRSAIWKRQAVPGSEFQVLVDGNRAFKDSDPELLRKLTDEGQAPPFMFLGCSDSRVSEGTVFGAAPGTLFTQRNIANQFQATDPNSQSVLAYAVSVLGVSHVIVMGHYGCGGVAAAIASPPSANVDAASGAVQAWIDPIRDIFRSSSRPEIVELRERIAGNTTVEEPEIEEPGFRALVEENVKVGVGRIASDSVIVNHYALLASGAGASTENTTTTPTETSSTEAPPTESAPVERRSEPTGPPKNVFIHGWVYDIATGEVKDLGVSVGPPGVAIPPPPFSAVASAADQAAAGHNTPAPATPPPAVEGRCIEQCKMKRSFLPRNH